MRPYPLTAGRSSRALAASKGDRGMLLSPLRLGPKDSERSQGPESPASTSAHPWIPAFAGMTVEVPLDSSPFLPRGSAPLELPVALRRPNKGMKSRYFHGNHPSRHSRESGNP